MTKLFKNKLLASSLVLVILSSFNMCALENVFASPGHHSSQTTKDTHLNNHHDSGHNEDSDSDHEKNGESLCCSDLVAVQSSPVLFLKPNLSYDIFYSLRVPSLKTSQNLSKDFNYQINFSPGASPPTAFLVSHFTHAPPAIL